LTVESKEAAKAAFDEFSRSGESLGVMDLSPLQEHNDCASFCFRDPGTNCWEIASPN
jgi:hypothetical protein